MKKTIILIPIYNDWKSVFKLLSNIDIQLSSWDVEVSAFVINDASTEKVPEDKYTFKKIKSVQVIHMKENRGHARCIAAGLKFLNEEEEFDYVIPMDGDGEDRPSELGELLCEAYGNPNTVITANRIKRSEGILFKMCYLFHKYITFIFTGRLIKFGNFTCLPKSVVSQMVNESATWSSFSGSLSKITKERKSIRSIRGIRYFGPSKMSFFNLIKHSFSIISVFKFTVLIRSLIFLTVYLFIISKNISLITLIPVVFATIMNISTFFLSKRENINEFNKSLENIDHVEVFK